MRALTLTQPWAGLVASGIKLVPCRGWQGFWHLPEDVERAVIAQVGSP